MTPWNLAARVPFRLRLFFRFAFALLAAATLALAVSVLQDEKQRARAAYAEGLAKSQAQIAARLRHPTGQLALLNPSLAERPVVPVRPLLLPFSAIDFDDRTKALQAVETAGCAIQYASGATLCAAVGSSASAGGFIYAVASFAAVDPLVPHMPPSLDLASAHRVRFVLREGATEQRGIAAFQIASDGRGRLAGYDGGSPLPFGAKPLRDFRGWMWQDTQRTYVSLRIPVQAWRAGLASWPPPALDATELHLQVLAPGDAAAPLFDSNAAGAALPFTLADLKPLLLPGETLRIRKGADARDLALLAGAADSAQTVSPWIAQLIRRLPVDGFDAPIAGRETIATPLARYELTLTGDVRGVNRALAAVATRMMWTVGAMLAAVLAVWLALEVVVIRRITLLTRRAAAVSLGVKGGDAQGIAELDLSDLRGGDELGVLARGLKDLLARVAADLKREQARAAQERDQWHAVGHEIVAPLQSLKALHAQADDPSARYIERMQQAVQVLYGQASPSEAIEARALDLAPLDLDAFLAQATANAGYVGIEGVLYRGPGRACHVRADEYSLEDVVTHVLRNANRHRSEGSPIRIGLEVGADARITIANDGPTIPEALRARIFEYGVSGAEPGADGAQRGQGLFVARTYVAKMGGTIEARNLEAGVAFVIILPLALDPR
jgi:signal transduction histidine kinase